MVLQWRSFTFSGSQYACMKASSCIYIVFYHALGLLRGEASRCFTGTVRIKSDGFAKDILQFFRRQYACMIASSCIYTVFYHALRLLRGEASRCFTGTVRIKSNDFAKDILHFFRIAVCLYESSIMHSLFFIML